MLAAVGWAEPPGTDPVMFWPAVRSPADEATAQPANAASPTNRPATTGARRERGPRAVAAPAWSTRVASSTRPASSTRVAASTRPAPLVVALRTAARPPAADRGAPVALVGAWSALSTAAARAV